MNRSIEGDNGETLRIEDGKFLLTTPEAGGGEPRELTATEAFDWFRQHDMPDEFSAPLSRIEADREDFFERNPKCRAFAEIFHYLTSLEISADVAADVAKSLLWAESRTAKGRGVADTRFQPKYSAEQFLSLFPEKAGASSTGICREAQIQLGMSASRFWLMLREQAALGTIEKTEAGLWRRK